MPFLKVAIEKRKLEEGESLLDLFERQESGLGFMFKSQADGRYSVAGYDPFLVLRSAEGVTEATVLKDGFGFRKNMGRQIFDGSPLKVLEKVLSNIRLNGTYPLPYCGCVTGFVSYDFGCSLRGLEQKVHDESGFSDYEFCFYDKLLVLDEETGELNFVAVAETEMGAERKVAEIMDSVAERMILPRKNELFRFKPLWNEQLFVEKVEKVNELFDKGELSELRLTERFCGDFNSGGYRSFKKLSLNEDFRMNVYFRMTDYEVAARGKSPLLTARRGVVEECGDNSCVGKNVFTVMESLLPSEAACGRPMLSAMKTIDRLEDMKRGLCGGVTGYFGFNGDAVLRVIGETVVVKDDKFNYQLPVLLSVDSKASVKFDYGMRRAARLKDVVEGTSGMESRCIASRNS